MEVSSEIKEVIRKTQSDLKNAIKLHQIWVARLQGDEDNLHLKAKVKEAEKEIIAIGQNQKLVVERLRKELELYQLRLKARNKQVVIENETRYIAQQLRDHQLQFRNRNRPVSLLKPSVLNEILIKTENSDDINNISDCENDMKSFNEKENSNISEGNTKHNYQRSFTNFPNVANDSRNDFTHALNKVKESFIGTKVEHQNEWQSNRSDSDSSQGQDISPTPSPPPLPGPGEPVSKEVFLRLIDLITHAQKELVEKKRNERRKRAITSTNRNDFLYGNYEMLPKRKKYNQFPYLQSHNDPPQTRSAKLRKQQNQTKSSREGSPSGSSSENRGWSGKPAWMTTLPAGLSVEPVYSPTKKVCHGCGRNDVPSLLVWCAPCGVWQHTGCGAGGACGACARPLPDPAHSKPHPHPPFVPGTLAEKKRLQEKNIQLSMQLRNLEARAATLKENIDEHNEEKRKLLLDQIRTQRNLQKLLNCISFFKDTSINVRSTSVSESGSELSKSNEE